MPFVELVDVTGAKRAVNPYHVVHCREEEDQERGLLTKIYLSLGRDERRVFVTVKGEMAPVLDKLRKAERELRGQA